MTQDVNIFYFGGSGGHFLLHLLMLTGQYQCAWQGQEQDFKKIFQHQWNIIDKSQWKVNETWPDNTATKTSNFTRKIYFTCNHNSSWQQMAGIKIVLYTDIKTQVWLAKFKRAFWFNEKFYNRHNQNFINDYTRVRGADWPDCNSIEKFNSLPQTIKDEWINVFGLCLPTVDQLVYHSVEAGLLVNGSHTYKNDSVYYQLIEQRILDQADIVVKLQDLIKTNGTVLFDQLGIAGNDRCWEFVKHWLNLHTEDQLAYLLK
jgi:hypothetical protein